MRERRRAPLAGTGVDIELHVLFSPLFDLVGDGENVLEVLAEDSALVFLLETEDEGGVAGGAAAAVSPGEFGAEEGVMDGVVRVEVEEDVGGIGTGEEVGVIGVLNGGERIEVGEDSAIELILLRVLIVARDFEGLVKVETVFEGQEPLVEDVNCRGFAEEKKY